MVILFWRERSTWKGETKADVHEKEAEDRDVANP